MIELMQALLSHTNPGFVVILAGVIAYFVRHDTTRSAIAIGGPLIGFLALMLHAGQNIPLATLNVMDVQMVLYQVDRTSIVFAMAFLIACVCNAIYGMHSKDALEDSSALVYGGAAVAAVFTGDLLTLFIFWELTAVSSVFLILRSDTKEAYKASMRYLGVQILSGVLLLLGAAYVFHKFGDMDIRKMSLSDPGAIFLFIAFGIKAAFPLLHNWLQDSYPKATATGSVVLSAFTTKLAVYALIRVFPGEPSLIWIGAIMTAFPVFFAVIENDLRKVLAYSINNQIGFMVCAVGIGTPLAINGAAAHAFADVLFKGLLYMAMGAVYYRTGTTKASELGGLYRTMPLTTVFCIIGAASISALPLFSAFATKSMILSAVGEQHHLIIWLMLLFASAGVLEHSGIKIPYFAFFAHDSGKRPKEAPFSMLLAMGIAASLCIWLGLPTQFGGTAFLYDLLPYKTEAVGYLEKHLWTSDHVLMQLQLVAFASFAFVVLNRIKIYPPEVRGINLDFDWVYRRPLYYAMVWMGAIWNKIGPAMTDNAQSLSRRIYDRIEAAFSPQGEISQGPLASGIAIWTSIVLTLVMLLSLFTGLN